VDPRGEQVEFGHFDPSFTCDILPHLDCVPREMNGLPSRGIVAGVFPLSCERLDREKLAGGANIEPVTCLLGL
jgi:hypothetical protein